MRTPVVYERSAIIDPTGHYRYVLRRRWGRPSDDRVLFIMLNPSTADAERDDATIRRCVGFAKRWGFGTLDVVNLFAYRSTDPRKLTYARDPIGPDNDAYILRIGLGADRIVAAWGSQPWDWTRERAGAVLTLLDDRPIYCLGTTRAGDPRHPVRLPGTAKCEVWHWPRTPVEGHVVALDPDENSRPRRGAP